MKTASKNKKAIIIALAAATGASVQQTCAATRQALADMDADLGRSNVYPVLEHTWDPFTGMYA